MRRHSKSRKKWSSVMNALYAEMNRRKRNFSFLFHVVMHFISAMFVSIRASDVLLDVHRLRNINAIHKITNNESWIIGEKKLCLNLFLTFHDVLAALASTFHPASSRCNFKCKHKFIFEFILVFDFFETSQKFSRKKQKKKRKKQKNYGSKFCENQLPRPTQTTQWKSRRI